MKTFAFVICAAALSVSANAALTVTPGSISNAYNGAVSLAITGLNSSGQRVVVEKFFDADNTSSVTAADVLMQRFTVTDGQVSNVAGRRNINVPGDNDGAANGSIQTAIYLTPEEIPARLDGRFLFRVSPDGAGFAPFTGTLMVTQQDYGGSGINGRVMAGAVAQAGALVLVTSGAPDDFDVVGVTVTDATGNYSLKLPAGDYRPVPVKPGYVFELGSSSVFTVNAGAMTAAGDASLTARTRTISGQVRDDAAVTSALGGMLVYCFGDSGTFTFTFANASGNYTLDALDGTSEVGVLETQSAMMGVLSAGHAEGSGTGNITGFNLTLPRPAALIYGTVRTAAGSPVPWLDVYGDDDLQDNLKSFSVTDAAGNYTLGILPGDWNIEVNSPSYLSVHAYANVTAAGVAVPQDLTVHAVTAHLRGTVRDSNNQIVPGLGILAHDYSGSNAYGFTDAAGNFDLGVYGGSGGTAKTWAIQLSQNAGDNPPTHISSQAEFSVTDGTDINGINYRAYLITAHLRGSVLDESNTPVTGVNLFAVQDGTDALTGSSVEAGGAFDIPVFAGQWRIGMSFPLPGGFMAQDDLLATAASGANVTGLIFRLRHTTGSVSGTVKNTGGTGIAGLRVSATATIGGASFSAHADTGGGGSYSFDLCPGLWSVNVDSNALINLGYQPVPAQQTNFTTGNVSVNFTASTGGGTTTFASWSNGQFTAAELNNPGISGPNADADGDGISNFLEYALNLAPKLPDSGALPYPGTQPGAPAGGQYLTLTFRRRTGAQGLAYQVLESSSLSGPWVNVTASYDVISGDGTMETVRAKTIITPGTKKFLRLQVSQQ